MTITMQETAEESGEGRESATFTIRAVNVFPDTLASMRIELQNEVDAAISQDTAIWTANQTYAKDKLVFFAENPDATLADYIAARSPIASSFNFQAAIQEFKAQHKGEKS